MGPVILVLGASGQLGQAVCARVAGRADVRPFGHDALDITDAASVGATFDRVQPTVVINCAAFNDVDAAEAQHVQALTVNGVAVGILARAAEASGAVFVHYSTDFVFAGRVNRAWTEDDTPEPQSVYAQSKLVGEWLAADCRRHYVLRVESLFGGALRRSTIDRIVTGLRAGRSVRLFHDRTVTPSFVDDVAEATWRLVQRDAPPGVYHCANSGLTTWEALGRVVAGHLGLDAGLIAPASVAEVTLRAPRPQYAALSSEKLERVGIPMPAWEDALSRYLSRLRA